MAFNRQTIGIFEWIKVFDVVVVSFFPGIVPTNILGIIKIIWIGNPVLKQPVYCWVNNTLPELYTTIWRQIAQDIEAATHARLK